MNPELGFNTVARSKDSSSAAGCKSKFRMKPFRRVFRGKGPGSFNLKKHAALGFFIILILFLALQPTSKAPIKDEGGYYRMTGDLPSYGLGVYKAFDMTSTSLTLITGGYVTMIVLGKTLFVARAYVLAVCILCLLISYWLLKNMREEKRILFLFLAVIAVNPLFSRYAHTYATD